MTVSSIRRLRKVREAPPGPLTPPRSEDGRQAAGRESFRVRHRQPAGRRVPHTSASVDAECPLSPDALPTDQSIGDVGRASGPASWYLVATEDKMIPPDAQRGMTARAASTVVEASGSHAIYVSQPKVVAELIAKAACSVALATR